MPDLFNEIVRVRKERLPAALATIVATRGSTPGREAMRLLVLQDGTFLGTVGGGCLEAEVYDTALEVLEDGASRTLQFRLTEKDSPDSGLLCGGEVTVFVESITGSESGAVFDEVVRIREQGLPGALATVVASRGETSGQEAMRLLVGDDGASIGTLGGGGLEDEVRDVARTVLREEKAQTVHFRSAAGGPGAGSAGESTVFIEPVTTPALWIFGGGHISKALCHTAALAGFRVTVCDDRESYANTERFPEAAATLAEPYPDAANRMPLRSNSYAVIVTRGHKEDGVVLDTLHERFRAGERPRFLGMIGSKSKRLLLFKALREQGCDEAFLKAVRSPVGLCIGARSHEEIAVAVVAELIAVRRTGETAADAWEARKKSGAAEIREVLLEPNGSPQRGSTPIEPGPGSRR